jgi:dihydrofolate synthase/folylpolyglutamate synthase
MERLGNPQDRLPPVIHIAGTNGKGSTIAFMRAIAEAAGLEVHAFTKPHLFTLNERFVIAGEPAQTDALIGAAERIAAIAPDLTQFDAQVAAAFLLFSETPADLVLLETGMGGRDDSTNVIERPAVSVVTPIGIDHQDVLGNGLERIAAHKAGIFKTGTPAVIARQRDIVWSILETHAEKAGATLIRQGVEWDAFSSSGRLIVQSETRTLDLPIPKLAGSHQLDNAGVATMALLTWRDFDDSAISAGIGWARWPGRLQPLTRGPLSAPVRDVGGEVWLDGGHNLYAAFALAEFLEAMERKQPRTTVAIIAMLRRKKASFVSPIAKRVDHVIALKFDSEHGMEPNDILPFAQRAGATIHSANTLSDAIAKAAQFPAPRVLICGSLALVAQALQLEERQN